MSTTIVLASGNKGKLRELRALLSPHNIDVTPQSHFNISDAEETGLSFVENALIKARHAASITGHGAIADDSGLEVDALNGAPGIYSARYAGTKANDADNIEKLLSELQGVKEQQRCARFQCVLVYIRHPLDPTPIICQGTWEGRITQSQQGSHGFGYDPVFFVREQNCTAAELPKEVKNTLSHRARAIRQLLDKI